jgi:hypothetical protein
MTLGSVDRYDDSEEGFEIVPKPKGRPGRPRKATVLPGLLAPLNLKRKRGEDEEYSPEQEEEPYKTPLLGDPMIKTDPAEALRRPERIDTPRSSQGARSPELATLMKPSEGTSQMSANEINSLVLAAMAESETGANPNMVLFHRTDSRVPLLTESVVYINFVISIFTDVNFRPFSIPKSFFSSTYVAGAPHYVTIIASKLWHESNACSSFNRDSYAPRI